MDKYDSSTLILIAKTHDRAANVGKREYYAFHRKLAYHARDAARAIENNGS